MIPKLVARFPFTPKSILCLRDYNPSKFFADLIAGTTVGLVALPLAMAFAISSGMSPQAGIYTAIFAGFIISVLGGSRCQIGGPTGAFVVVVSSIVLKFGTNGLFVCTIMSGILLVILGLTGLGNAVKYIPRPVVIGFTNGIAVLIASTQIKDFFGLRVEKVPGDFLGRIEALSAAAATISPISTAVGGCCLVLIILMVKYVKKIPGTVVAMLLGSIGVWAMRLPLDTIESRFGGIPSTLPHFAAPTFSPHLALALLSPVLTVTMLGAVESLLSAVVADRMSGDRHNSNVELIGQGVANIVSPLFGGLPATGAIARTATNIRSGAQTPIAGMLHAVVLLVILLVGAPLAKHIPLCVLAAILFVVSHNMGEWREIPEILKLGRADVAVWLITFALTIFADLSVAVEVGMILAALLYIGRVTGTTTVAAITPGYIEDGRDHSLQLNPLPPGVAAFRIHGPFLFGSTDKLATITDRLDNLPAVVILRLRNMNAIDGTGLKALEDLADQLHQMDRTLILCGIRDQPAKLMHQAEFDLHIGPENICRTLKQAILRAEAIIGQAEQVEMISRVVESV